jgi:hypothetical protein
MSPPEYKTLASFLAFLREDEATSFTAEDLQRLNESLGVPLEDIRACLEEEGYRLEPREVPRYVRGFTTSSNDRWFGPGAEKTHGGTGF